MWHARPDGQACDTLHLRAKTRFPAPVLPTSPPFFSLFRHLLHFSRPLLLKRDHRSSGRFAASICEEQSPPQGDEVEDADEHEVEDADEHIPLFDEDAAAFVDPPSPFFQPAVLVAVSICPPHLAGASALLISPPSCSISSPR
ncbi:unnamed protein product [Lactuca virosa]|uniref:Uncharacterized protein n=1 Tax=Lactuca virosa TaxID=75947 RepID=A0AAU9M4E1_9ASTR|nr:unnamed protein product [Lactuca virosa]